MSHISFRPRHHDLHHETDFVVVGSGAGGATAAAQLARGGASVTLVEAGAWRDPEHYPHSCYGGMKDLLDDWGATITVGRAFWPVVQARTMGGSTVVNSAICVRTPDDIFDLWTAEHGVDPALRPAFERYQDDLERELSVELVPPASMGRMNTLAVEGAAAAGIPSHVLRRYVKGCAGSGRCLTGCALQRKQTMNVTFVPEVLRRGGTVLSCAPVARVVTQNGRATGVTGWFQHPQTKKWGAKFTVTARRAVVVAASATASPALLLRSRIPAKALGRGFRAHPGTGVFGIYDEIVDLNTGATQGWASTAFRDEPGFKLETLSIPPGMVLARIPGGGREYMARIAEYRHMAMWVHAVRAESEGRIHAGPGGKAIVRYSLNKADMVRFRAGMLQVARLHFAAGAKAVAPGIYGLPWRLGPDDLHLIENGPLDPRCYLAILSHLFGGCTMGSDPSRSVCDSRGRVHGTAGLAIADASALPTTLGVNPQHTIMAWARWVADGLLDEL
ncbi:MAG: choline dehydrogenase-like flavoprotein [Myxococcota bacterium]